MGGTPHSTCHGFEKIPCTETAGRHTVKTSVGWQGNGQGAGKGSSKSRYRLPREPPENTCITFGLELAEELANPGNEDSTRENGKLQKTRTM